MSTTTTTTTTKPSPISLKAKIAQVLTNLLSDVPKGKSNLDPLMAEAYLWDEIADYAKKQSKRAWDNIESTGMLDTSSLEPGTYTPLQADRYILNARISDPIRRFKEEEAANLFNKSKYKVPVMFTIDLLKQAKIPTKSSVTLWITER